jgi:hypothetical protein
MRRFPEQSALAMIEQSIALPSSRRIGWSAPGPNM